MSLCTVCVCVCACVWLLEGVEVCWLHLVGMDDEENSMWKGREKVEVDVKEEVLLLFIQCCNINFWPVSPTYFLPSQPHKTLLMSKHWRHGRELKTEDYTMIGKLIQDMIMWGQKTKTHTKPLHYKIFLFDFFSSLIFHSMVPSPTVSESSDTPLWVHTHFHKHTHTNTHS